MKVPFFFFSLLALSGCATAPKPPTRYIPVPCVSQDQLTQLQQAEPEKVGSKLTGQAQEDVKTIAESAIKLRDYANGLLGVLGGCAGDNK